MRETQILVFAKSKQDLSSSLFLAHVPLCRKGRGGTDTVKPRQVWSRANGGVASRGHCERDGLPLLEGLCCLSKRQRAKSKILLKNLCALMLFLCLGLRLLLLKIERIYCYSLKKQRERGHETEVERGCERVEVRVLAAENQQPPCLVLPTQLLVCTRSSSSSRTTKRWYEFCHLVISCIFAEGPRNLEA